MKIDISAPQPCPVCGESMHHNIWTDKYNCSWNKCALAMAALTIRELNTMALLVRLKEVVLFSVDLENKLKLNSFTDFYGHFLAHKNPEYGSFLECVNYENIQERDAIFTALKKLED